MPNMEAAAGCGRCNGTGEYHGTRRDGSTYIGSCFSCQGFRSQGFRGYGRRSNAGAYAAQAAASMPSPGFATDTPAAQPAAPTDANWLRFAAAMPAQAAWLLANGSPFAASLTRAVSRYGNLTPRQLACVDRNLTAVFPTLPAATAATDEPAAPTPGFTADAVAAAQAHVDTLNRLAAMAPAAPVAPAVIVEAGPMRTALLTARESGLRKPRLTLGLFEFRLGQVNTFRARTIYVYTRENIRSTNWTYRAAISDEGNVFFARGVSHMDDSQMELVRDAAANPRNAAAAHGHDTTYCSCCRRLLTDPPSVMAGIGPVCITRFGWSF